MNPIIFEALMLVCFGIAWPFSIYRLLKTKKSHGKSVSFLVVLMVGYVFGILFEVFGNLDAVILLYVANMLMVSFDLFLTLRYRKNETS